ncbi:MAG: serine hydroxymethyltransferase [Metamycoplasmataceae bacterium]
MKDKEIEKAIKNELERQKNHIELIASENYVSMDVLEANGSILTNKYGEGYPSKRYYNGCENVDIVEKLAIERIKKLFKVDYANVQPHSGSSANAAAFAALIKPGDKVLGMALSAGGHLTHGYNINFSGIFYKGFTYGTNDLGLIDYDEVEKIAIDVKPNLIICGASAYSREIDFKRFSEIAKKVNAFLLADVAHIAGAIVTGLHNSPVGYADIITSTTHKTLRASRGGIILTNDKEIAERIDKLVFPGLQGGPLFNMIAGKAVGFYEALKPSFISYQKQIKKNSQSFCDEFQKLGAEIISGGTDNHLFIIDVLKSYNLTGKDAANILMKINIIVNKNTIPNETKSPFITSGIRVGTPAMTTRGFKEKDFRILANLIDNCLKNYKNSKTILKLKKETEKMLSSFPIYQKL